MLNFYVVGKHSANQTALMTAHDYKPSHLAESINGTLVLTLLLTQVAKILDKFKTFYTFTEFILLVGVVSITIQGILYNGNHPQKKGFMNFANLEAFTNVFLHLLS